MATAGWFRRSELCHAKNKKLIHHPFLHPRKQSRKPFFILFQAGEIVVGMAFRVGDGEVDFVGGDLAAAEVVAGGEAGKIRVEGELGEGFLLDLEKEPGVGGLFSGDFEPETDAGEKEDGLAVQLI